MKVESVFRGLVSSFIAPAMLSASPLTEAVKTCQTQAVEALLPGAGGTVNLPDEYAYTPAMWAISRCDAGLLQSLVKNGAALPAQAPRFSPIAEAAKNGRDDVIAYLLARQYKIDAKDERAKTALMWAVSRPDTLKVLLDSNADVNAKDANGQTALIIAAQQGNLSSVTLLLGRPALKVNEQDKFGYTALAWAARGGQLKVVKALLAAGADKSVKSKDGSSALDAAARRGKTDVAQALQ